MNILFYNKKIYIFTVNGKHTLRQTVWKIWFNGKTVEWADANIHILNHGLHYASCVFEEREFMMEKYLN